MPQDLPKAYDPAAIEDHWAEYWVRERIFELAPQPAIPPESSNVDPSPDSAPESPGTQPRGDGALDGQANSPAQRNFTMLLPPPNVTGRLHMGHMLNQTEMDILTRWHRMSGDRALWIPGTDHASIATQMMVERQLATEGLSRHDLGREAFVERAWKWKQHYGGAILEQMKRLGVSVDWSRLYFTMDERLNVAVREAFVRLYEQGLIYRGAYIVNWCPRCQTAISDLEVVHEEQAGKLYEFSYPVEGEPGSFLNIATTRPETMLGDVAVAVHPDDERYTHLHGRHLLLPLSGGPGDHSTNRRIPVITDAWVSRDFGTGAVKVTPAHDPNDFALGKRHNLPSITVLDESAHMTAAAGAYAGLDRYEARARVVADLDALGLVVSIKDHLNSIGKCDRCGTVVEPLLSTQWFLKIQPLADKAIQAVEEGHIRFTPEQYSKTYFQWMRNIYDWCISRQLWWGQRIPAWFCDSCHEITVSRQDPSACSHCGSAALTQEKDVLDTWFSSGLLPFTLFGWPEHTTAMDRLYPTQLLITGFDILFFWVARMIMLSCHFMLDVPMPDGSARTLADAVPFREVYIHALVRAANREKMSKTKGNVIDPIGIVERFGTDAVRFTLASMASPGTDIAFSEARTEGYRAFANKIWNAARFIFMNVERAKEAGIPVDLSELAASSELKPGALASSAESKPGAPSIASSAMSGSESAPPPRLTSIESRWIQSRFNQTAADVNQALKDYRFDEAANLIYQFFWGEFCDWYLEIVKLRLDFTDRADKQATAAALNTLLEVFEAALRLLSPFMPFLTEEIWHAFYNNNPPARSIALTRYPQPMPELICPNIDSEMTILQDLITAVRTARKEAGVEEKAVVPILMRAAADERELFESNHDIISKLARVSTLDFPNTMPEGARSNPSFDVAIVYKRTVDIPAERDRLTKEVARYEKEQTNAQRQLANESFLAKAPAPVIEGIRRRAAELIVLLEKTRSALDSLNT
ncbi:MAG TPA: valine--tRNA ligase [Acidisarcina sp.]